MCVKCLPSNYNWIQLRTFDVKIPRKSKKVAAKKHKQNAFWSVWCIIVNCQFYISDVSKKLEGQSDAPPQYFQKVTKFRNLVLLRHY